MAIIAFATPAASVVADSPIWTLAVGATSILFARVASDEIRASSLFTGRGLSRAATLMGGTLMVLACIALAMSAWAQASNNGPAIRAWIGTASLATAVIALSLKGIDRVLTGQQKQMISDALLRVWMWLDDQMRANYRKLLWREQTQRAILWLAACAYLSNSLYYVGGLFFEDRGPYSQFAAMILASRTAFLVFVSIVFLVLVFSALLARSAYRHEHVAIMKQVEASTSLGAYFALLFGAVLNYSIYIVIPILIAVTMITLSSFISNIFLLLGLVNFIPVLLRRNTEAGLLVFTLALSLLFLALTMYAKLLLYVAERTTAIVLESKDGVIISISTACVALGAVLRLIG